MQSSYKFYRDIYIHNFLDNEAQMKLLKKLSSADNEMKKSIVQKLTLANIGLVNMVANEFLENNKGIDYDDLMSLGLLRIINVIGKYDFSKGKKLSNYLYICIKRCMKEFSKENKVLDIKKGFYKKISSYNECVNEYYFLNESNPPIDYIKDTTDLSDYEIMLIQILSNDPVSLSDPIGDDMTLIDSICSDDSSIQDIIELRMLREIILDILLNELKFNEYLVLRYRYGLYGAKVKTQEQLAEILNCSHQNVGVIEQRVLKKLAKNKRLSRWYYGK